MRLLILAAFFVSVVKCMKLEISIKPLQDDGEAVGESACESEFFKEECSKGDKIYKTYANVTLRYCEYVCSKDMECKSFFVRKYDCFLTKIALSNTGPKTSTQTTSSLGIAGPVAKLQTVTAQPGGVYKSSVGKDPPDCSEFHFEDCDETPNDNIIFEKQGSETVCLKRCDSPEHFGIDIKCNSFAFAYNNASDSDGGCFTSEEGVMDFMEKKCKYKRGRVNRKDVEVGNFESLLECIEKPKKASRCMRGDCKLDFLEPLPGDTATAIDEETCQNKCGGKTHENLFTGKETPCTHYKWEIPARPGVEGVCEYYYVKEDVNNTGSKSRRYECDWYAATPNYAYLKDVNGIEVPENKEELDKCKAGGAKNNETYVGLDEIVCTKKFRVKHATEGKPVEGATIKWHLDHLKGTDQTGKTDWFGEFEVNLTAKNVEEFDFMKIVVSKEGFDDQEIAEVPIKGDWCEQSVLIALNPKSKDGRIILAWDKNVPTDIDLYLIEFAQKQIDCKISYEQMTADCSNNTLDIDNQKGGPNGPETITVKDLDKAKTYMVLAHKFSSENTGYFCGSGARVAVCVGNQGCKQHYSIPKKCFEKSSVWLVGCFKGTTGPGDMKVIDKLIANDDQTQYPEVSPLPSISECGY